MNIVFASSEMAPFAKTGGLADVCGSLPLALADSGMSVKVFLPKYKGIDSARYALTEVISSLSIVLGEEVFNGKVYSCEYHKNVEVFFIEQKSFFERDSLYGTAEGDYPDNAKRFIFFQKSVLEALRLMDSAPDVIHCHDWQTALIPVYVKTRATSAAFCDTVKTVFTIHNLAYQGVFSKETFDLTGLPEHVFSSDGLEFYGKCNFMKAGILYSDRITTVSKRYAEEIQMTDFGCGLEGVIKSRRNALTGILNGVNVEEWDSTTEKNITVNFAAAELDKKYINKGVLQKENGLPVDRETPLFGMVCRLVDQKGLDILNDILPDLMKLDLQLVILGTGDSRYHATFKRYAGDFPKKLSVNILFDDQMAKRIYAGSDVFLMPSQFEPCGLGQLIAYRFSTVPLVRQTGGLADTVIDFNKVTGTGTGFVFSEYTGIALLEAIKKAVAYYKEKKIWKTMVENGTRLDFSWKKSAEQYVHVYEEIQKKIMTVS